MIPGILGLIAVALFAAVLFVPRCLRRRREPRPAGTAAVSPERSSPASGGMAVPVITDVAEREAFAYDDGLTVGEGRS